MNVIYPEIVFGGPVTETKETRARWCSTKLDGEKDRH